MTTLRALANGGTQTTSLCVFSLAACSLEAHHQELVGGAEASAALDTHESRQATAIVRTDPAVTNQLKGCWSMARSVLGAGRNGLDKVCNSRH